MAAAFVVAPLSVFAGDGKEAAKDYPLKTCVVSGEKLGEMGKPYIFTHEGKEVRLCCKDCLKKFKADPAKYLKKIEEAEKAGKK
jgi:YHS domain-containing protein